MASRVAVMGWAVGYDSTWKRDIGYGVPSVCDRPRCGELIDRGLSYVCGGEAYGGDEGCGLYFCSKHLNFWRRGYAVCGRCSARRAPYAATPDVPEWIDHKLKHESWQEWRDVNEEEVAELQRLQAEPSAQTSGKDEHE